MKSQPAIPFPQSFDAFMVWAENLLDDINEGDKKRPVLRMSKNKLAAKMLSALPDGNENLNINSAKVLFAENEKTMDSHTSPLTWCYGNISENLINLAKEEMVSRGLSLSYAWIDSAVPDREPGHFKERLARLLIEGMSKEITVKVLADASPDEQAAITFFCAERNGASIKKSDKVQGGSESFDYGIVSKYITMKILYPFSDAVVSLLQCYHADVQHKIVDQYGLRLPYMLSDALASVVDGDVSMLYRVLDSYGEQIDGGWEKPKWNVTVRAIIEDAHEELEELSLLNGWECYDYSTSDDDDGVLMGKMRCDVVVSVHAYTKEEARRQAEMAAPDISEKYGSVDTWTDDHDAECDNK